MNAQWDQERKKTDDAEAKAWDKNIWEKKVFVPEDVARERARLAALTPEELAMEKAGEAHLDDLIEQAWQLLRSEAEVTLRVNPQDEKAQRDLLQCKQYDFAKAHPEMKFEAGGKVVKPVGRFVKLRDGTWGIRITRSKVGDVVQVQSLSGYKKQSCIKKFKLTKELGTSLYRGREV
jgi:hypothetical protein